MMIRIRTSLSVVYEFSMTLAISSSTFIFVDILALKTERVHQFNFSNL